MTADGPTRWATSSPRPSPPTMRPTEQRNAPQGSKSCLARPRASPGRTRTVAGTTNFLLGAIGPRRTSRAEERLGVFDPDFPDGPARILLSEPDFVAGSATYASR